MKIKVTVNSCLCSRYAVHRDLHSFPTRRSSDLLFVIRGTTVSTWPNRTPTWTCSRNRGSRASSSNRRSEEHTSELQSRGHLVCRLLLEKKKNNQIRQVYNRCISIVINSVSMNLT